VIASCLLGQTRARQINLLHLITQNTQHIIAAGQKAEQELKRASAEAELALQSVREEAAQAQQRAQQLEEELSQLLSSYESLQKVPHALQARQNMFLDRHPR
jgi:Mg2+ and Co2+ transporter CorA